MTRGEYGAYHIVYPEIFLGKDENARIDRINENMKRYLEQGIFRSVNAFILVERTTKYSAVPRFGLMVCVDLDAYDFKPFNDAYIKATEGTILERLPVRIKIRENALMEIPHIILLTDDADKTVIEPIAKRRGNLEKLYDFELNKDGGRLKGYIADNAEEILKNIYALADKELLKDKYGVDGSNFLFAVGDGNHSLATAKACWEKLKAELTEEEQKSHPAKYALVELMNLYDDALKFEPIHRVVFNAGADFCEGLKGLSNAEGRVKVFDSEKEFLINADANSATAIRDIQTYIEEYLKSNPRSSVDYIHGEEHLREVVKNSGGLGILMPSIKKSELFPYVINNGVLPKKAFSMGEAEEKRYYLECKLIKRI
ncbi:MAG: DUF1015 domain-containing protein, partial [Clostridiales bacterium]|jgi:uncharacterized protein (DUF1015 family)|nr:DUF1015 domain-containing protein [Clostridiales bacterium]